MMTVYRLLICQHRNRLRFKIATFSDVFFFFIPVRLYYLRHGLWEPLYKWDNKTISIYARSAIIYNDLATIIKTPVSVTRDIFGTKNV